MTLTSSESLRAIALAQFAAFGFEGASLQRIASEAGLSKSSVLYHFESKEALLDAALRPGVEAMGELVAGAAGLDTPADRAAFLDRFVGFLFDHRLAVVTIVNHGQAMSSAPVIVEADRLVAELALLLEPARGDELDALRFGVGMAGAAFVLAAADRWSLTALPGGDVRQALTQVLSELVFGERAGAPGRSAHGSPGDVRTTLIDPANDDTAVAGTVHTNSVRGVS